MNQCRLTAIGTAVPPNLMTQLQAAELACELGEVDERQTRTVNALYRRTGVKNRYTCVPHQTAREWYRSALVDPQNGDTDLMVSTAGPSTKQRMSWFAEHGPDLATRSARKALEIGDVFADQITHLITVTCTGFVAPGLDIELIESLKLPATTQRIQIGFMGCHGAINGFRAAKAICESDPDATVLLNATELCSIHYHFTWGSERLVGNSLFGDGSASAILQGTDDDQVTLLDTGSCLIPSSKDAMSWHVGDLGFEMMLSAKIPDLIQGSLKPWLQSWLSKNGHSIDSIEDWIVHPGGPRILDAVSDCLGLPVDALDSSREVLRDFGNMSSPTVMFVMQKRASTQRGPCVMLGFGPGLMAEAALFA